MKTTTPPIQKARSLASRLRTSRHDGRAWDGSVDRALVRQTHDVYLQAISTGPTFH